MHTTPPEPAPKRTRLKAKEAAAKSVATTAVVKKTRTRKSVTELPPVTALPTERELNGMIATAAYYLAAERSFSPGRELDDWLEAERRIRAGQS